MLSLLQRLFSKKIAKILILLFMMTNVIFRALADPRSVLDAIELDIQELENSIKHLKRSNIEMEEYLRTDPDEDIKVEFILIFLIISHRLTSTLL
jgi:hypothetical protein